MGDIADDNDEWVENALIIMNSENIATENAIRKIYKDEHDFLKELTFLFTGEDYEK